MGLSLETPSRLQSKGLKCSRVTSGNNSGRVIFHIFMVWCENKELMTKGFRSLCFGTGCLLLCFVSFLAAESGFDAGQRKLNEALARSVRKCQKEVVQQLLQDGADPNSYCGTDYLSAYHYAIIVNDPELINFLQSSGGSLTSELKNTYGKFKFSNQITHIISVRKGLKKGNFAYEEIPKNEITRRLEGTIIVTKYLLKNALNAPGSISQKNEILPQCIHAAEKAGDTELLELFRSYRVLQEKGETFSESDSPQTESRLKESSASAKPLSKLALNRKLYEAIQNGHKDIVQQLLQKSADPNYFPGSDYLSLFHSAIIENNLEIIELLRAAGASIEPELRNMNGSFRLSDQLIAIINIRRSLIKGDIDSGQAPANPEIIRQTIARRLEGTLHLAKLLLENRLNVSANSPALIETLQKSCKMALSSIDQEMAELLLTMGAKIDTSQPIKLDQLFFHSRNESISDNIVSVFGKYLEFLKGRGISVGSSFLPQIIDISEGLAPSSKLAELLIKRGASISRADRDGNTPLHLAVIKGNVKIVRLLLDAGALPDAKNGKGQSPLDISYSSKSPSSTDSEIESLLRKKGATPPFRFKKLHLTYPSIVIILSALCAMASVGLLIKGKPGNFWSMLSISFVGFTWYYALESMQVFAGRSSDCWSILEIRPDGFTWKRPLEALNRLFPASPFDAALDPTTISFMGGSFLSAFLGWQERENTLRWKGCALALLPALLMGIWISSLRFPTIVTWLSGVCVLLGAWFFLAGTPARGLNILGLGLAGFTWWQTGVVESFNSGGPADLIVDPAALSLFGLSIFSAFIGWKEHENDGHPGLYVFPSLAIILGVILPVILWVHNAPPRLMF